MNYSQIQADDPGGDIVAATATLAAMTETVAKSEHMLTERGVYWKLGGHDGETFLSGLETVAQDNPVVARVVGWLKPINGSGVDIVNPETQAVLNSLVGVAGITQAMVDSLIELASETKLKYPGIKFSHVQKVRA